MSYAGLVVSHSTLSAGTKELDHETEVVVSVSVTNNGEFQAGASDEVVMVFDALSAGIRTTIGKTHPVPIRRLVDFERSTIAAGASVTVAFKIPKQSLALTTADGSKKLYSGEHELVFSRGNGNEAKVSITV